MRIAFGGDVNLETDPDTWEAADVPDLHETLGVDMVVVNFESTVDGREIGSPAPRKTCLTTPAANLDKLKRIGVDVVCVSNNHLADFGPEASRHTIETLQSVFGEDRVFGWNDQPSVLLAPGLRVLGVSFPESEVTKVAGPTDFFKVDDAGGLVERFAGPGEKLVVCAHWGWEFVPVTDAVLRERARTMIGEGAAQVVGNHGHVVGAAEDIGDATAVYGLGNLIFRVMPRRNKNMLRRSRRSGIVVYDWDGSHIRLVESWTAEFDARFNLSIEKNPRRFPGGRTSQGHLRLPAPLGSLAFGFAIQTRWIRLAFANLVEGVERPSFGRAKTLAGVARKRLSGR